MHYTPVLLKSIIQTCPEGFPIHRHPGVDGNISGKQQKQERAKTIDLHLGAGFCVGLRLLSGSVHVYCDNGLYWPILKFACYGRNVLFGDPYLAGKNPLAGRVHAGYRWGCPARNKQKQCMLGYGLEFPPNMAVQQQSISALVDRTGTTVCAGLWLFLRERAGWLPGPGDCVCVPVSVS